MTRFIGLTGGIGAGKSEVLAAFERAGAPVLSTDAVAHDLLDAAEVRDLLVERWGPEVAPEGRVDRDRVARIVFESPDELRWLESETHPRVGRAVLEWREGLDPGVPVAVVEVPLLFEAGMEGAFDATVAVVATDPIRESRLAERGQEGLAGRESRQLSQDEKAARADHVIRNDGTLEELDRRVIETLDRLSGTETPAGRRPRRSRRRRGYLIAGSLAGLAVVIVAARSDLFEDTLRAVTLPLRHEDIIRQQADEKQVPADLIAAVIYAESRFRDQESHAGARGLMQVTPQTAELIEELSGGSTFETDDLSDPDINIRYGTFYLRYLLDKFDDNTIAALAAYNAGETNVANWGGSGLETEDIRFPETRQYVEDVSEKRAEYRRHYARELGLD